MTYDIPLVPSSLGPLLSSTCMKLARGGEIWSQTRWDKGFVQGLLLYLYQLFYFAMCGPQAESNSGFDIILFCMVYDQAITKERDR